MEEGGRVDAVIGGGGIPPCVFLDNCAMALVCRLIASGVELYSGEGATRLTLGASGVFWGKVGEVPNNPID